MRKAILTGIIISLVLGAFAQSSSCSNQGSISFQRWNSITGTSVNDLKNNSNYPSNPSTVGTLTTFEITSNSADNYGVRIQGYICPPTTGNYIFWIAGDDNCELLLSTDQFPANKRVIAYHNSYTGVREWTKFSTQKSVSIALQSGRRYYVEAIMKEGTGSDNLAVGWARPGQSTSTANQVIPGSALIRDFEVPSTPTALTANSVTTSSLNLTWTASTDNIQTTGYDVYRNGAKINSTPVLTNSYAVTGLTAATTYSFYVIARDAAANVSTASTTLNVTTLSNVDTQAPTAPTGLAANSLTQSGFNLSWTAASDNVAVTGYDVFQNAVKINSSNITATTYTVSGLTVNTTYAFTVKAKDAAGNVSASSATLNITTPDTQAPTAPGSLSASNITQSGLNLSWSASTDNVGVSGYNIYQNGVKVNGTIINGTTFNVSGLSAGTSYSFTVKATDAAGNESAASSALNVTTPDTQAPTVPSNLAASALTFSRFNLTWSAASDNVAVTGYDVYQNGVKINSTNISTTSFVINGLTGLTAYAFTIKAKDAAGNESSFSTVLNVTTPATGNVLFIVGATSLNTGDNAIKQRLESSGHFVTISSHSDSHPLNLDNYDLVLISATVTSGNIANKYKATSKPVVMTEPAILDDMGMTGTTYGTNMGETASQTNLDFVNSTHPIAAGLNGNVGVQSAAATFLWGIPGAQADIIARIQGSSTQSAVFVYESGKTLFDGTTSAGKRGWLWLWDNTFASTNATGTGVFDRMILWALGTLVQAPDTQSPTVPTALSASNVSQSTFTLSWAASTDNVAVTGYDVFQNGVKINSTAISGISFNVTGLSASTTYAFTVVASDAAGNQSVASAVLNVTTPDTQAPSVPTNLNASNVAQNTLTLNWTASTDNVGVEGYDVYRNGVKINGSIVTTTNFNVSGLSAATAYSFTIKAKDAAGNESAASATLNVSTLDTQAPTAPTALIASNVTQSTLTLSWSASTDNVAVTGYDVYQDGLKINGAAVTATSFNVTGLSAVNTYSFSVKAKDAAGNESASSTSINVTTPDTEAPSSPSNLSFINLTSTSLTLNWSPSTDNISVAGYDVYVNGVKANGGLLLNPTFDLSTLIAGATYSLTVKAKDLAGNKSAASTALVVTTPDVEAPSIPGSLIATNVTYNSIAISWLPSTDNVGVTGYDVYRNGVKMNASNVAGTSYTFTGLSELTTYSITVKAKDAAGNESDFSNNLDVTTLQAPDLQAPSVPNGLSASNITQNSLSLDWSPSTDNVGVEGYDVYQNGVKINTVLVNSTSFNVTGLQAAVAYTFVVLAKDLAGNTSAPSSSVIITTPDTDAPSAPGNPSAFSVTNSSATVSWSAATDNVGVTGYDVYVDGVKSNISLVTNTSFNLTGLAELTAYNITVKAKDAAGNESVFSGTLNFTTLHAPDTQAPTSPTALVASGLTQSSVTITWTASTDNIGVAGYDVYRNGVKINGAIVSTTSFNVSGLSAATTYSFTVKAKDAAGNESTASSALNVTTPDTQAPSTPTGLVSSALTQSSVTISWTASTDNVGVTGYDVYQNGVKVNGSTITTTSFNVTGLSAATSYAFTVKAKDAAGNESTASSALNVTTPDTQAPTAPTGLASSALTQSSVTISWTASTDNIGVTGYDVYRNGVKVNGSTITTTSFNVTGLSAATSYAFTVKAKDAAGNESAASSALNVTTPDTQAPTTPTGLASSALTQSSVTISWTASTDNVAVAGYDVYRNGVKVNGSTITTTSFNVTGLSASTAYAFTVKAKDAAGNESAASSALNVTTPDTQAPTAPTGLASASLTQTSFTLSWTASTDNVGVTGYDVYRNGTKINGSLVTTTSYSVTGLTVATTYAFTVKAKDAAGNESAASTALNVTTPDTQAPTAPTGLVSSNITQSGFTVTWTAATDNVAVTGYDVYLDGVKVNASLVTVLNYTVSGLSASTTYAFSVRARDAAGNTSASSTSLNVTTSNAGAIENFTMRTVIANQRMPWDITWGPDNNIWYTERTGGRVSFVNPTTGVKRVVLTLGTNMVQSAGQDGLMGMAIHPEFNSGKPYVYIGYTYQTVSTTVRKTRIARYTYNFTTQVLESPVTILQDIPGSNDHNSGRMTIGPDLKLYYTVGDMGAGQFDNASRTNNAQNLNVYEGKVLRLNLELINSSWIPADNPFTGTSGKTAVYSYGHRNAQGLVWANVNGTNRLYSSEHGPYSDDEINLIESAGNYGWPQVSGLCDGNYNGRTIGGFAVVNEQTNCTNLNAKVPLRSIYPVATPPTDATNNMTWPSSAPSGIDFYSSNAIPGWQNSLLVANLKTGTITRFKMSNDGSAIISDTINYFRGKGRFRDVIVSPDGLKIYVACDSSGSTSGPTGGVVTAPANAGSILEFTYVPSSGARSGTNAVSDEWIIKIDDSKDRTVDIYPNPARDFVIVYNYKIDDNRRIELYNVSGQLLKQQQVLETATRLETSDLSSGLYLIRVIANDSDVLQTEKLMIVR